MMRPKPKSDKVLHLRTENRELTSDSNQSIPIGCVDVAKVRTMKKAALAAAFEFPNDQRRTINDDVCFLPRGGPINRIRKRCATDQRPNAVPAEHCGYQWLRKPLELGILCRVRIEHSAISAATGQKTKEEMA